MFSTIFSTRMISTAVRTAFSERDLVNVVVKLLLMGNTRVVRRNAALHLEIFTNSSELQQLFLRFTDLFTLYIKLNFTMKTNW